MTRSSRVLLGVLAAAALPVAPALAEPGTTPYEAEASNMGICSSYLGAMQVRDDVNGAIRVGGDTLGIRSPGELFRVRAQQTTSLPPAQECLRRHR